MSWVRIVPEAPTTVPQMMSVGLASTNPVVYDSIEAQIASLTQKRDDLAGAIRSALDGAAFRGQKLDENQEKAWIQQAKDLIAQAQALPH